VNADGTADPGFQPGTGVELPVNGLVLQADGSILVSGFFQTFNGGARPRLVRLYADGAVDPGFRPSPNNSIYATALDAQGRLVVGGQFQVLDGSPRPFLGRLALDRLFLGDFED
jgi:hypothetical protein